MANTVDKIYICPDCDNDDADTLELWVDHGETIDCLKCGLSFIISEIK